MIIFLNIKCGKEEEKNFALTNSKGLSGPQKEEEKKEDENDEKKEGEKKKEDKKKKKKKN